MPKVRVRRLSFNLIPPEWEKARDVAGGPSVLGVHTWAKVRTIDPEALQTFGEVPTSSTSDVACD